MSGRDFLGPFDRGKRLFLFGVPCSDEDILAKYVLDDFKIFLHYDKEILEWFLAGWYFYESVVSDSLVGLGWFLER